MKKAYYVIHAFLSTLNFNPVVISQVRNTLTGTRFTQYEREPYFNELVKEVILCMYLLDVSQMDMIMILDQLHDLWSK